MITVNAMGDACPIPVVKTKKAIATISGTDTVEVLVDNAIAVQNLTKMAEQKGYVSTARQLGEGRYCVEMTVNAGEQSVEKEEKEDKVEEVCMPDRRNNTVVVFGTNVMGDGNADLGATLIKGFIYAISQQDKLPKTMLFYNGGAKLTCEGSASIEDLKALEAQGVEILTCGTCLNFYGIADKLQVGGVTNMYVIAEKMSEASLIIKP